MGTFKKNLLVGQWWKILLVRQGHPCQIFHHCPPCCFFSYGGLLVGHTWVEFCRSNLFLAWKNLHTIVFFRPSMDLTGKIQLTYIDLWEVTWHTYRMFVNCKKYLHYKAISSWTNGPILLVFFNPHTKMRSIDWMPMRKI